MVLILLLVALPLTFTVGGIFTVRNPRTRIAGIILLILGGISWLIFGTCMMMLSKL